MGIPIGSYVIREGQYVICEHNVVRCEHCCVRANMETLTGFHILGIMDEPLGDEAAGPPVTAPPGVGDYSGPTSLDGATDPAESVVHTVQSVVHTVLSTTRATASTVRAVASTTDWGEAIAETVLQMTDEVTEASVTPSVGRVITEAITEASVTNGVTQPIVAIATTTATDGNWAVSTGTVCPSETVYGMTVAPSVQEYEWWDLFLVSATHLGTWAACLVLVVLAQLAAIVLHKYGYSESNTSPLFTNTSPLFTNTILFTSNAILLAANNNSEFSRHARLPHRRQPGGVVLRGGAAAPRRRAGRRRRGRHRAAGRRRRRRQQQ